MWRAVVSLPNCLVGEQVSNGIAVRMAVLFLMLAGERGTVQPSEHGPAFLPCSGQDLGRTAGMDR